MTGFWVKGKGKRGETLDSTQLDRYYCEALKRLMECTDTRLQLTTLRSYGCILFLSGNSKRESRMRSQR